MVLLAAGPVTLKIEAGHTPNATVRLGLYDTNARDLPPMNRVQVNQLTKALQSVMAREMNPKRRNKRETP